MKRLYKIIFTLTLCLGLFVAVSVNAQANTISSVSAVSSNGKITVSGMAEEGTLACAVFVYDSTESTLLGMETCEVNADNSFRYQMSKTYAKGDYVVKVADYDGGSYKSTTVKVTDATADAAAAVKSPKTSEMTPWFLMVAGLLVLGAVPVLRKRNHQGRFLVAKQKPGRVFAWVFCVLPDEEIVDSEVVGEG